MSETQLLGVIAASAAVIAVAMVLIAVVGYAALKRLMRLEERSEQFFRTWEPVAEETRAAAKDFSEQSGELLSRLNTLTALVHKQALQADSLLGDLALTARRNVSEVDATVRGILDRINSMVEALERVVTVPATKIRAVGVGLGTAFRHLARPRSKPPDRISTDEEMFI